MTPEAAEAAVRNGVENALRNGVEEALSDAIGGARGTIPYAEKKRNL